MNKEVCVQSWPCSYFLTGERRWIPGRLSLTPLRLRFRADNTDEYLVSFHLSGICEVKKESSSYIFSSITVLEKDQAKHWFSSIQPNRNVVFNVLEHFWREQLLSSEGSRDAASKTSKGRELINIVSGSQKRMEDTTQVLHHQGKQFEDIVKGLNKIEGDMDTAGRMLSILETPSWWPFGFRKGPSRERGKDATPSCASQNRGKEGIIATIPIIFSRRPDYNFKPGKLTVLVSALEISDCDSQLLHRYEREEVDDVKVSTGYDICVRQRFIGKPDIAYRILSAKLPDVIPVLELQYKKKIEFLEEALMFSEARKPSPANGSSPVYQTDSWYIDAIVRSGPGEGGHSDAAAQRQEVSESEVQELRKMLTKLKCIALEAEEELERQDETLEEISSSTDKAITTIDKQNRRMRKLL
ncbi:synaptosomal-associated protein 47 [Spea bombifrons]|uniref:synaptosomal-associated protein 47 n=1 Tax=Spea bombifrons TaxID=233779 RepID=UPI0023491FA9|nr:synaptosomal-associated protein 47 [Spea bombifrons]